MTDGKHLIHLITKGMGNPVTNKMWIWKPECGNTKIGAHENQEVGGGGMD